ANAASVAEHALALMLAVAKRVVPADRAVRGGDFDYRYRAGSFELTGKTLGVVGWGRIGRRTAAMARAAFGMAVLVYSASADAAALAAEGARRVDRLAELLAAADVVSLHAPLRPDTRGLIGAAEIALMRPDAILVNTGRGAVVDEAALAAALREGRIAGAGLDVFGTEPPPPDHPLLGLPNAVLSPHMAGSSREALERTAAMVADGMVDALAGRRPEHLVNPEVWERRRR
ncbi:MAG TPA: NAD(P)-dependent oxidoreductase, partial [Geminicoccaceae bacterium]|nr:NAD(P)-dependent oxidoreductase [Geminicoccaceae bacterium]